MALSLALSVIATTGTGMVLTARIVYGMASYRVLPESLANVSRRFATPVPASILVGLSIIGLSAGDGLGNAPGRLTQGRARLSALASRESRRASRRRPGRSASGSATRSGRRRPPGL